MSSTSGRVAGSFNCSGVATRLFRSPAKSAVRKPAFFAGAMSRARFDPTCRISLGTDALSPRPPAPRP